MSPHRTRTRQSRRVKRRRQTPTAMQVQPGQLIRPRQRCKIESPPSPLPARKARRSPLQSELLMRRRRIWIAPPSYRPLRLQLMRVNRRMRMIPIRVAPPVMIVMRVASSAVARQSAFRRLIAPRCHTSIYPTQRRSRHSSICRAMCRSTIRRRREFNSSRHHYPISPPPHRRHSPISASQPS